MEKGRRSSSVHKLDRLQQQESSTSKSASVTTQPKPAMHHRRSSYPPPSPSPFSSFADEYVIVPSNMLSPTSTFSTSPSSTPMTRAISTPSPKSPLLYSFASPPSPDSELTTPSIPNSSSFSALGGTKLQQKEERRKKLDKLQRLLGERVPAHLALNDLPGRGMSITELNLANSNQNFNNASPKGVGRLLKGAIMGINNRSSSGNWAESYNQSIRNRPEEEILIINLPEGSDGSDANSAISPGTRGGEGDQSVLGMAKARKLEQVRLLTILQKFSYSKLLKGFFFFVANPRFFSIITGFRRFTTFLTFPNSIRFSSNGYRSPPIT